MKDLTPEEQLDAFISKYAPEVAAQARAVLAKMRAFLPGAIELVYDNYNALAIGFGTTERTSDAVFSIVVFFDGGLTTIVTVTVLPLAIVPRLHVTIRF